MGLPIDRDEVEEAVEAAFELDGEVTGAGSAMGRCHLDLEIAEDSASMGRSVDRTCLSSRTAAIGAPGCYSAPS